METFSIQKNMRNDHLHTHAFFVDQCNYLLYFIYY